nr:RNA-directed DNA polymerase, eukaryota [Tanacetum cinerariifolium]
YKVPKGVLKEMEAIRCNFFNGADPAKRKITWVSWDKVLASKKNGGLGVSSFHALNRALLLKWVWRFLSQDGSLWYRVIQALYGASFELHPVNQSSIWCSILREMQVLISKCFEFVSHCKKRVGDGHNTQFWYDSSIFDQLLRVRFPRLFTLETDKSQWLLQSWDLLRWICDLNGDGVFHVKEVRTILDLWLRVCHIVNASAGRLLGAYDLGVATPKAFVHAGDKISGDARSWYMISGDAKSWVMIVLHIFSHIAQLSTV